MMKTSLLTTLVLALAFLTAKSTSAQKIKVDYNKGISIQLPLNQPNKMQLWVHDGSTTMIINGKFYSTIGTNKIMSNSPLIYVLGGDHTDDITINGSSTQGQCIVLARDGDDVVDCKWNRPFACDAGKGNDTIWGSDRADIIAGREGMDVLYGRKGDDWLAGGLQKDMLDGGPGDDKLYGNKIEKEDLGTYWGYQPWSWWYAWMPDGEKDFLQGGKGADRFFHRFYSWSDYLILGTKNGGQKSIWPLKSAYQIKLESEILVDYVPGEGDVRDSQVLPLSPWHGLWGQLVIVKDWKLEKIDDYSFEQAFIVDRLDRLARDAEAMFAREPDESMDREFQEFHPEDRKETEGRTRRR